MKKNSRAHFIVLLALIAAALVILFIWADTFPSIDILNFEATKLISVIGSLFVFAMLVERFLEIFVPDGDTVEKESLEAKLKIYRADIELLTKPELNLGQVPQSAHLWAGTTSSDSKLSLLNEAASKVKSELSELKKKRRTLVIRISFIVGLTIAVTGVRVMHQFIEDEGVLTSTQLTIFTMIDTVLTASVISGGSDGIHKLIQIVKRFTPNPS